MSWTKRQLVLKAYGVCGLASYAPNLTATQLQDALDSLDSQMNTWADDGIVTLYPLVETPSLSDLDTDSLLVGVEIMATYMNLAVLIAPELGKTLSNDTQKRARSSYTSLLRKYTVPVVTTLPDTLTRGQGSKYWRNTDDPFFDEDTTTTTIEVI
jgi:hypothetical protein